MRGTTGDLQTNGRKRSDFGHRLSALGCWLSNRGYIHTIGSGGAGEDGVVSASQEVPKVIYPAYPKVVGALKGQRSPKYRRLPTCRICRLPRPASNKIPAASASERDCVRSLALAASRGTLTQ